MAQLLFYENIAPVSVQRHKDLSVDRVDFGFAANVTAVPIMAVEIPAAAAEYAIVFAGTKDAVLPVVLLGMEDGKNQFVDADGNWKANYVPAFVRRYPFVFSQNEDKLTLCVDESWDGCNREGKGERLFDDDGKHTAYLDQMLNFLKESQSHFARTHTFGDRLKELGLLETIKADFTSPQGEKRSVTGFMAVSREKLKQLAPKKLAELVRVGELELAYIHLLSINNLKKVFELSTAPKTSDDAAQPAEPAETK